MAILLSKNEMEFLYPCEIYTYTQTYIHTEHNYAPLFFCVCVSYINRIHLENIFSLQRFFEHSTTFFKGKTQKRICMVVWI